MDIQNTPLISCIITTYKRKLSLILRAINSVLGQTHKNIELIIVDDNHVPNDYSDDIANYIHELNDKRITYIKLEKNQGACFARNIGIEKSKGQFIAFLDDDDEWLPEKLDKQYERMSDLKVGLVYCSSYSISPNKKTIRRIAPRKNMTPHTQILLSNFIGSTSFPLIRKECFDSCGNFDENLKSAQDLDVWIRILKKYKIDFVDIPLCNYYFHNEGQITNNIHVKIKSLEHLYKKYYDDIKINRNIHNMKLLMLANLFAQERQTIKFIRLWIKAVVICPWKIFRNTNYLLKSIRCFLR